MRSEEVLDRLAGAYAQRDRTAFDSLFSSGFVFVVGNMKTRGVDFDDLSFVLTGTERLNRISVGSWVIDHLRTNKGANPSDFAVIYMFENDKISQIAAQRPVAA